MKGSLGFLPSPKLKVSLSSFGYIVTFCTEFTCPDDIGFKSCCCFCSFHSCVLDFFWEAVHTAALHQLQANQTDSSTSKCFLSEQKGQRGFKGPFIFVAGSFNLQRTREDREANGDVNHLIL